MKLTLPFDTSLTEYLAAVPCSDFRVTKVLLETDDTEIGAHIAVVLISSL